MYFSGKQYFFMLMQIRERGILDSMYVKQLQGRDTYHTCITHVQCSYVRILNQQEGKGVKKVLL